MKGVGWAYLIVEDALVHVGVFVIVFPAIGLPVCAHKVGARMGVKNVDLFKSSMHRSSGHVS